MTTQTQLVSIPQAIELWGKAAKSINAAENREATAWAVTVLALAQLGADSLSDVDKAKVLSPWPKGAGVYKTLERGLRLATRAVQAHSAELVKALAASVDTIEKAKPEHRNAMLVKLALKTVGCATYSEVRNTFGNSTKTGSKPAPVAAALAVAPVTAPEPVPVQAPEPVEAPVVTPMVEPEAAPTATAVEPEAETITIDEAFLQGLDDESLWALSAMVQAEMERREALAPVKIAA